MKCGANLPASAVSRIIQRIQVTRDLRQLIGNRLSIRLSKMWRSAGMRTESALLLGVILLVSSTAASGGGLNLLTVLNTNSSDNASRPVSEAFEVRTGSVALDVNQVLPKSPTTGKREASATSFKGSAVTLGLFFDKQFSGVVTSEARPEVGVLSLHARRDVDDIATVTMTVSSESYMITIQDLPNAMVYRIVGNTETGVGVVTQIDLKLMPPVLDGAPIIPPSR